MTERNEASPGPPKWWRRGQGPAWARARGWGPWQYSLTLGICWGLFVWLTETALGHAFGDPDLTLPTSLGEMVDDLTYWLTAGLLFGAVMFFVERREWNGEALTGRAGPHTGKARFLVENAFAVTSRRVFVIQGCILSGAVERGQRVTAPSGIDAPVDAIDFVLLSATEGREAPGLAFRYRDAAELARWQALDLKGQALELEAPISLDAATDVRRALG